jgi:hypothetical protein
MLHVSQLDNGKCGDKLQNSGKVAAFAIKFAKNLTHYCVNNRHWTPLCAGSIQSIPSQPIF